MKFHTWQITVSTVEDLDRTVAEDITAYLKKKCHYGLVVLEHSTKWHLHASVCFKSPIEKKHFEETIWLKVEKAHPTSRKRVALVSTVQYTTLWITEYLKKDCDRVILWDKMDLAEFTLKFPTETEQAQLKELKAAKKPDPSEAKDPRFARFEIGWISYSTDVSYEGALKYLQYAMNVERSMSVIVDPRRLHQTAWALFQYRAHSITPSVDGVRFGHLMDGTLTIP